MIWLLDITKNKTKIQLSREIEISIGFMVAFAIFKEGGGGGRCLRNRRVIVLLCFGGGGAVLGRVDCCLLLIRVDRAFIIYRAPEKNRDNFRTS